MKDQLRFNQKWFKKQILGMWVVVEKYEFNTQAALIRAVMHMKQNAAQLGGLT